MPTEPIQVDTTEHQKGEVKVLTKDAFSGNTPTILARVTEAIRYFCAGLVVTVGATDLLTGGQAKVVCFVLGIVVLLCGAIDKAVGVVPRDNGTIGVNT